jgi:transcriptional regulator with XRE-family HTH domain
MAFTKNPNTHQGAYALTLRKRAGAYLKGLRQDQKLTQSDMAKLLGIEYYTFVSQVETGLVRVPPEQLERWAMALKVSPQELAKTLMQYYDPFTYEALFGKKGARAT